MGKSTCDGFGDAILELGKNNPNIVVLTADLPSSTRVDKFAKAYPERFFDVGVAEQNLIGVAAGLALSGKIPFVTSFACFSPYLNFGQIRQTVCYNKANVKIIGSHAGLATGADGATHQSLEDIALMRVLPGMTVIEPIDYNEAYRVTLEIAKTKDPTYLRLSRPSIPFNLPNLPDFPNPPNSPFLIGKAQVLQQGAKASLIGAGPILAYAFTSSKESFAPPAGGWEIINCSTIKPIDRETIINSIKKTGKVFVLEDHQIIGGLGSAIAEIIAEEKLNVDFKVFGVNDSFGESARNYLELWEKYIFSELRKIL